MQSETLNIGLLAFVLLARGPYIGRSVVWDASLARLPVFPIVRIGIVRILEDCWLLARHCHILLSKSEIDISRENGFTA